jgi:hypothetical protein
VARNEPRSRGARLRFRAECGKKETFKHRHRWPFGGWRSVVSRRGWTTGVDERQQKEETPQKQPTGRTLLLKILKGQFQIPFRNDRLVS